MSKMGRTPAVGCVAAVGALILAGCDVVEAEHRDAEYAAVCVQEGSNTRLPDDQCGDWDDTGHGGGHGSFFVWVSTGSPAYVPPVGGRVDSSLGARTFPPGTPVAKGVSPSGQTVQRGGFGVKSGTAGGTGAKAGGSGGS